MTRQTALAFLSLLALALANPAHAHEGTGVAGGFASGFLHPIGGVDHLIAMAAVGLWGAFLRQPAIWVLPIVFPLVMAMGGAAGVAGIPLPQVETAIALSGLVLGLLIAFAVQLPLWVAGVIVGAFAIFHGHAHGAELPEAANPVAYSAGFVISTGLIHLCGIALGALAAFPAGLAAVRATGVLIAAGGVWFLLG